MIQFRPYRKAYNSDEAVEEIKLQANKKYSSEIVDAFMYAIEEFKKL